MYYWKNKINSWLVTNNNIEDAGHMAFKTGFLLFFFLNFDFLESKFEEHWKTVIHEETLISGMADQI